MPDGIPAFLFLQRVRVKRQLRLGYCTSQTIGIYVLLQSSRSEPFPNICRKNSGIPGQGFTPLPNPLKLSKIWGLWGLHKMVCIIGICPEIYISAELGCGIGHLSYVSHKFLQHLGQGQGERWKEEWGPVEGKGESVQPPRMLPFRAWCSPACTSSAQLLHLECTMQLAACAAGFERAQNALGSSVPRLPMHVCVQAVRMRAQYAHIIHAWFAPIWKDQVWVFKVVGPPKMTGSWWIRLGWWTPFAPFHRWINFLLNFYRAPDSQHRWIFSQLRDLNLTSRVTTYLRKIGFPGKKFKEFTFIKFVPTEKIAELFKDTTSWRLENGQ